MQKTKTFHRKKIVIVFAGSVFLIFCLLLRLSDLMIFKSEHYASLAKNLHERERSIKAQRGKILDRNGIVLADNRTVCTISVIHSQIREKEKVIELLAEELKLDREYVKKRVEKNSSLERVAKNVEKEVGDRIRNCNLAGVKVDEDYKRYYPFGSLASKVLGFTGGDNQGIIGLEVQYDSVLEGEEGKILTLTDARGIELPDTGEDRKEPAAGSSLYLTLDYNIQKYAEQEAYRVLEQKEADSVSIILMNPQNGEIYAMTNVPEFDLNHPYQLPDKTESSKDAKEMEALNQMWRNGCINDTYEPGSAFKVITASAGLEEGVVKESDSFFCPGYKIVEDRRIRCHKAGGHGSEDFVKAIQNSCNPVFIEVGLRLGTDRFLYYFEHFGLKGKTGVDLPGEAAAIMHKKENIGQVELATISFGQSFQITPLQLAATISSLINGGERITPHLAKKVVRADGTLTKVFWQKKGNRILSEETSARMRALLEKVVDGGGGRKAYIEGYRIGGKTATSETLPRSANLYISSFVGFAPADDPQILGLCVIKHPKGVYYGGTIAAPVIRQIFENVLPYLNVKKVVE